VCINTNRRTTRTDVIKNSFHLSQFTASISPITSCLFSFFFSSPSHRIVATTSTAFYDLFSPHLFKASHSAHFHDVQKPVNSHFSAMNSKSTDFFYSRIHQLHTPGRDPFLPAPPLVAFLPQPAGPGFLISSSPHRHRISRLGQLMLYYDPVLHFRRHDKFTVYLFYLHVFHAVGCVYIGFPCYPFICSFCS
jgi:hypothetical protein